MASDLRCASASSARRISRALGVSSGGGAMALVRGSSSVLKESLVRLNLGMSGGGKKMNGGRRWLGGVYYRDYGKRIPRCSG